MKVFLLLAVVAVAEGKLNWCQDCSVLEPCPNSTKNTACIVDFCSTLEEGEHVGHQQMGCETHPETKYRIKGDEITMTFSDGVFRQYGKYYGEATAALDALGRAVDVKDPRDDREVKAKFEELKSKLEQLPAFYAKPPAGMQVDFNKTFASGGGGGQGLRMVDLNVEQIYIFDAFYTKFRQEVLDFEAIFLMRMKFKNFKPSFEKLENAYRKLPSFYR